MLYKLKLFVLAIPSVIREKSVCMNLRIFFPCYLRVKLHQGLLQLSLQSAVLATQLQHLPVIA